jgi:uroporphyrinogen-III decarboxylase
MAPTPFDVYRLRELYQPDPARLALARRRQAAFWRHARPDAWPATLSGPLTAAQQAIPNPNFKEAFEDADLMLCSQVRAASAAYSAGGDGVPSIRVNFGTGVCLACLGLEQEVFEDKMPWLRRHLTKEEIARLTPDAIKIQGSFARGLDYIRRFREVMEDRVPVYCMDTQGPFDLAHLLYGDDLFYAVHDDPPFVHHLMEIVLELGVRTHRWMKEVTGEPLTSFHHSNVLYAENIGVRICEDTTSIVSPAVIEEFALPYTRQLAQRFGGAWVHYCGRNDHLTEFLCAIPEVRGINFGHVPGREHDHCFEEDMRRCQAGGKIYFGNWPRREGETGRQYLQRLHVWAKPGVLFPILDAALAAPEGLTSAAEVLSCWYELAWYQINKGETHEHS